MPESTLERLQAAIGHQYEIGDELGRGGMSVVFRARDRRLHRDVAIKVLPPELARDPAVRTRFAREAHTSAQLSHPHIVPIYDVGEREGIAWLVMGLVNGGNLADCLARDPRPSVETARRILAEVADALGYAHGRGVIHRDIKPDNILLERESGRALVTDFGIARAMEAGARLTQTGIAVGTPTYMSPEQATGDRDVDGRSDIYSLGVVAYQMLTGRVPFTAPNNMALLLKHVTERPRPIGELRPEAPRPIRETIERALAKSPDDRWPSATVLREALLSDEMPGPSWRSEREPVRYASPSPEAGRRERAGRPRDGRTPSPSRGTPMVRPLLITDPGQPPMVVEPPHLASLTPEQRDDLALWHGRANLLDRVKAARRYVWYTLGMAVASMAGVTLAVETEAVPLILAPVVPLYMMLKLARRGRSLRDSGLRLRRVFLMPRATWVIPGARTAKVTPDAREKQLEKIAPRAVLDGPYGAAIRRAADDRTVIREILAGLSKEDRALVPDLGPTVEALVERVMHLVKTIERVEAGIDPRLAADLDARMAALEREADDPDAGRRLAFLRRQRASLDEMLRHRASLVHQLESAGLALGTLRLDLIKLRSSGLQSARADVSTATQEARALSHEIGALLDAMAEMRAL